MPPVKKNNTHTFIPYLTSDAAMRCCDWLVAAKMQGPGNRSIRTSGCLPVASSLCQLAAFFNCSVTIPGLWYEFLKL